MARYVQGKECQILKTVKFDIISPLLSGDTINYFNEFSVHYRNIEAKHADQNTILCTGNYDGEIRKSSNKPPPEIS